MEPAYPLRCQPLFRNYLWGGRNLQTRLGKEIPAEGKWAESWELLDHPQHSSQVVNGPLKGKKLSELIAQQNVAFGRYIDVVASTSKVS